MFKYLRPNFSYHPLNYLLSLLVFVGSFSFASMASAFEDDGTWVSNKFYYVSGYYPATARPTASEACSVYGNMWGSEGTHSGARCNLANGGWQTLNGPFDCSSSTPLSAGCGESPISPEPQGCNELAEQNPDPFNMSLPSGFTMTVCRSGCKAISAGGFGIELGDGSYFGQYRYTGIPCPGGFNAAAGDVTDVQDIYQHDDELQSCYTPDGVLIGRIGTGMPCPSNVYACYDEKGTFTGTAPGGSVCEKGSKNFASERPNDKTQSTQRTCDSNGVCTEVSETTSTQKGADGSTVSKTTKTTKSYDANGNLTSETTETEESSCLDETCNAPPDSVTGTEQCVNKPLCTGDIMACELINLQWEQNCSTRALSAKNLSDYLTSDQSPAKGVEVDEYGQMTALDGGEINIADGFNFSSIFKDSGRAGSCPADTATILGQKFSWSTICESAEAMRWLVIFAAVFLSVLMIRRSIFGA